MVSRSPQVTGFLTNLLVSSILSGIVIIALPSFLLALLFSSLPSPRSRACPTRELFLFLNTKSGFHNGPESAILYGSKQKTAFVCGP